MTYRVIVCGTEPNDWNDIRADIDLATVDRRDGRTRAPRLQARSGRSLAAAPTALVNNTRPVWFAGHSSRRCDGGRSPHSRCKLSYIFSNRGPYTLRQSTPWGIAATCTYVKLEAYRWVNNNDIVTRVPPWWLDFRRKGQEDLSQCGWRDLPAHGLAAPSRTAGGASWADFEEWKLDQFTDHSITRYIG